MNTPEENENIGTIYDDLSTEELAKRIEDADLEAKLAERKATIMKQVLVQRMIDNNQDKITTENAVISRAQRTTFTYSEEVTDLNEEIKKRKKIEELEGIAIPKYTDYLVVKFQ